MNKLLYIAKEEFINNFTSLYFIVFIGTLCFILSFIFYLTNYFKDIIDLKQIIYFILFSAQFITIPFFCGLTINSFSGEIDKNTMQILFTIPINKISLYFGKILSILFLIPIVLIVLIIYFLIVSTLIGIFPIFYIKIIIEVFILFILTNISIIGITSLICIIFRKTIASAVIMFAYIMLMILISFTIPPDKLFLSDDYGPKYYDVDYLQISFFPFLIFFAGIFSVQMQNYVDINLYLILILYIIVSFLYSYIIFRRMEL